MKHISLTIILLTASLAVGCHASSMEDLRQNHAGSFTFEIEENYQSVYHRTALIMDKCTEGSYQALIFPDTSSSAISWTTRPGYVFSLADIKGVTSTTSKISIYYPGDYYKSLAIKMMRWIKDGVTECLPPPYTGSQGD